jgi:hypothetical protein
MIRCVGSTGGVMAETDLDPEARQRDNRIRRARDFLLAYCVDRTATWGEWRMRTDWDSDQAALGRAYRRSITGPRRAHQVALLIERRVLIV